MTRFRCEIVLPLVSGRFVSIPQSSLTGSLSCAFTIMNVHHKIFKTQHFQRQVKKYSELCCVPLCFHGFPVQNELRTRWLVNTRHDHLISSSHTKVCSRHFTPDQLIEPKTTGSWRRLVKGAVGLCVREQRKLTSLHNIPQRIMITAWPPNRRL